jgi:hypothetical protein
MFTVLRFRLDDPASNAVLHPHHYNSSAKKKYRYGCNWRINCSSLTFQGVGNKAEELHYHSHCYGTVNVHFHLNGTRFNL